MKSGYRLRKKGILTVWIWILTIGSYAQSGYFTAFAVNPKKTPDSLLVNWHGATDLKSRYDATVALCRFHESTGFADSVLYYAQSFTRHLEENEDQNANAGIAYITVINLFIADAYKSVGLLEEATRYYLENVQKLENSQAPELMRSRTGLADVYYLKNDLTRAATTYDDLLRKKDLHPDIKSHILFQLGSIALKKDSTSSARDFFETVLAYYDSTGNTKKALSARLNLGIAAEKDGGTDTAFRYYDEVKEQAQNNNFYDLYISAGQRIADLFIREKEYQNAEMLLTMVYTNAIQWGNLDAQLNALRSLEHIYIERGDYKNAYGVMSQFIGVSREKDAMENKREVREMEVKYQTAQKEKEILLKENQISKQRSFKYMILVGFVIALIPILGLLYVYYQKLQTQSRFNAMLEEASQQKISNMLQEKELAILKASVEGELKERNRISRELHDSIGGSLAAIKMRLSESGLANLGDLLNRVDEAYQQVREVSHNLSSPYFANSVFTEVLNGYLDNFRKPGMDIGLNTYPEEAINNLPTPVKTELFKIIQELMTNSLKHARADTIDIQLTEIDDSVKLMFEDNGMGFDHHKAFPGLGLSNIKNRVQMLQGNLVIDSKKGRGTIFDIDIPLKTADT